MSPGAGGRGVPPRRTLLVGGAVLLVLDLVVHLAAADPVAAPVGRLVLALVAVVTAGALLRRSRPDPLTSGLPWLMLAFAVVVAAAFQILLVSGGSVSVVLATLGHVLAAALAATGLYRLPAPPEDRRGLTRVLLDAAIAGLAFAVPAWEFAVPAATARGFGPVGVAMHPGVNVVLATAGVAVLSRARRGGGVGIWTLCGVTGGSLLLVISDQLGRDGVAGDVVSLAMTLALAAMCAGAAVPDRAELAGTLRWRERIAVFTPLAPVVVAAGLVLGSVVFHHRLSQVTTTVALLLGVALVASTVLARLEHLLVERRLDELVLERTATLGTREKWFRSLVQNSSDVITVVDGRGVVRFQTPSVTRILGHDPADLVGTTLAALLRPGDARTLEQALAGAVHDPSRPVTLELPVRHRDGHWCDTETTITSLVHDPDIRGLVLNTRDVSERRRLEAQLTQQAFSDPLTGLANRSLFRAEVESALRLATGPGEVAVMFLDLDGFKAVNDAHGHHVGDELLVVVGKRLAGSVRPHDLVARLGGDEFGILVTGPDAEASAAWIAERIRTALEAPFRLQGRQLALGASTGVAVADTGAETADQLLRNADLAMYRAKADGTHGELPFVRFEVTMHDALLARVQAEADLRDAVGAGELTLHYQPLVELTSGRIIGVEALVRWNHPERGLVAPGEFIELAEETGLVGQLGAWALEECCRQGATWQRFAAPGGIFKIAVNVSGHQLDAALPRQVHDALARSGLPGAALTLEMTESVLMDRTEDVVALLQRMKTLGVRVAVDDFGTGYSSLSYLSRFPVDILKIDRSFVSTIGNDAVEQAELVETIVRLGQSLRLDTVAEGIETAEQAVALAAMGCAFGQGFYFSRPLPAADLDALLTAQDAPALHGGHPPALAAPVVDGGPG